ncbi:hypothetical protein C8Q78DRAFT_432324 [Trametes maxima]|nr:hypothetical protein C8Q78DRAFT_432324 [Trametes maxima]
MSQIPTLYTTTLRIIPQLPVNYDSLVSHFQGMKSTKPAVIFSSTPLSTSPYFPVATPPGPLLSCRHTKPSRHCFQHVQEPYRWRPR